MQITNMEAVLASGQGAQQKKERPKRKVQPRARMTEEDFIEMLNMEDGE